MRSNAPGVEGHARTLRGWQLALLRFAVTLDNADRLAVMAIAREADRLGAGHGDKPDFSFFWRTSAGLCAAILQPDASNAAALRQYLARIEDARLRRAFAAAIEAGEPKVSSNGNSLKHNGGLWRGLSPRANERLQGLRWM